MKSLSSINDLLHNNQEFYSTVNKISSADCVFPLEIQGIHGSLFSYFISLAT